MPEAYTNSMLHISVINVVLASMIAKVNASSERRTSLSTDLFSELSALGYFPFYYFLFLCHFPVWRGGGGISPHLTRYTTVGELVNLTLTLKYTQNARIRGVCPTMVLVINKSYWQTIVG